MTNSRRKGAHAELSLAQELCKLGIVARRGQQYCGSAPNAADVVCENVRALHIECKRVEEFKLYKALAQAEHDAQIGGKKLPVVFHRRNRKKWVVVLDMVKFVRLLEMAKLFTPDIERARAQYLKLTNEDAKS